MFQHDAFYSVTGHFTLERRDFVMMHTGEIYLHINVFRICLADYPFIGISDDMNIVVHTKIVQTVHFFVCQTGFEQDFIVFHRCYHSTVERNHV